MNSESVWLFEEAQPAFTSTESFYNITEEASSILV